LPADIGLRVKRNNCDSAIKVEAIVSVNDETKEFIDPHDVCVAEIEPVNQIYYYHKSVDVIRLLVNKSLRMRKLFDNF